MTKKESPIGSADSNVIDSENNQFRYGADLPSALKKVGSVDDFLTMLEQELESLDVGQETEPTTLTDNQNPSLRPQLLAIKPSEASLNNQVSNAGRPVTPHPLFSSSLQVAIGGKRSRNGTEIDDNEGRIHQAKYRKSS